MARIFYSKDGNDPARTNQGPHIEIATVATILGKFETKYFQGPPPINEDLKVGLFAAYRHVVIDVDSDETCERFPKPGYYYVCELSPKECNQLLNGSSLIFSYVLSKNGILRKV